MIGNRAANFIKEALGEGAFLAILVKAWDWAKIILPKIFNDTVKEKIRRKMIDPKSWDDENFFARDLAEAGLSALERAAIDQAVLRLENFDRLSATKYAKNFRNIVTAMDAEEVPAGSVRPGILIIRGLVLGCSSVEEVFARIIAIGTMQDSFFSFEKFLKFGEESIWPFLKNKAGEMHDSADVFLGKVEQEVRERNEKFERLPWWKKLLKN